MKRIYSD